MRANYFDTRGIETVRRIILRSGSNSGGRNPDPIHPVFLLLFPQETISRAFPIYSTMRVVCNSKYGFVRRCRVLQVNCTLGNELRSYRLCHLASRGTINGDRAPLGPYCAIFGSRSSPIYFHSYSQSFRTLLPLPLRPGKSGK